MILTQIYSSWIAAKFKCVASFIGLSNSIVWALCSLYFINEFGVTKLCQKNLTAKDLTQPIFVCADSAIPPLIEFGHCRAWLAGLSLMKLQKSLEQLPKIPKYVVVKHEIGVPLINVKNRTKYDLKNTMR